PKGRKSEVGSRKPEKPRRPRSFVPRREARGKGPAAGGGGASAQRVATTPAGSGRPVSEFAAPRSTSPTGHGSRRCRSPGDGRSAPKPPRTPIPKPGLTEEFAHQVPAVRRDV